MSIRVLELSKNSELVELSIDEQIKVEGGHYNPNAIPQTSEKLTKLTEELNLFRKDFRKDINNPDPTLLLKFRIN
jgi:hypothetical protein